MVVKSIRSWLNSVCWLINRIPRASLVDLMKLVEEKSKSAKAGWRHGMMFMLGALSVFLFNYVVSSFSSVQGGLNGFKPVI